MSSPLLAAAVAVQKLEGGAQAARHSVTDRMVAACASLAVVANRPLEELAVALEIPEFSAQAATARVLLLALAAAPAGMVVAVV